MVVIKEVLHQCSIVFDKKTSGSGNGIKNEKISNKKLDEESHK